MGLYCFSRNQFLLTESRCCPLIASIWNQLGKNQCQLRPRESEFPFDLSFPEHATDSMLGMKSNLVGKSMGNRNLMPCKRSDITSRTMSKRSMDNTVSSLREKLFKIEHNRFLKTFNTKMPQVIRSFVACLTAAVIPSRIRRRRFAESSNNIHLSTETPTVTSETIYY